ncbi:MAG: DsbA family protein [Pseudoruegeria sp.]
MRLLPNLAALFFAVVPAHTMAADLQNLSEPDRIAFGQEVRAYILNHPALILEAIEALEREEAARASQSDRALVEAHTAALHDASGTFIGGNTHSAITVVEFVDYKCGYCKRAHQEIAALIAQDDVRLIIREFPILGEESQLGSRFAISTLLLDGPVSYKKIHDHLMTMRGNISEASLQTIAKEHGLNADLIMAKMGSDEVTTVLRKNQELARALRISGTPAILVGDVLSRGYLTTEKMIEILDRDYPDRGAN